MKKWWYDPVLWLMLGSSLLIFLLSYFWLRTSYQDAREDLRRETSFLFASTVRALEDSLIHHSFINHLNRDSSGVKISFFSDSTRAKQIVGIVRHRLEDDTPPSHAHRKWHRRTTGLPMRMFAGSLSLHLKIKEGENFVQAMQDSGSHPKVLTMLEATVVPAFDKAGYPFTYKLQEEKIDVDSIKSQTTPRDNAGLEGLFTRPYYDLASAHQYFVVLTNVRPYLLQKISYQLVFSLLLIGVTLLAFVTSYRSLSKQRRLALLKNDLVSNITHELKTPIATVKVALEALQNFNAGQKPEKRNEYLQIAGTELDRLALLVENVLKTSVQEVKEMTLKMEKINLTELVGCILKTMQLQFDKVAATVTFQSPKDPSWINADRIHLTSVIYNLIDNALKYSPQKPKIDVAISDQDGIYKLAISDQGLGISKDHQSKIFEKFYRIPQINVHNTKGYGLGLNYAAQVIKKHRGSITVQSEKGSGSTFTITMPQSSKVS